MSAEMAFPETDDYTASSALGEAEISRLIKTAQAAQFVARDGVPKKTENNFKPRSLVEIAFAAEKVRQGAQKSYDQNNMSQSVVSQNDPTAQNLPYGDGEQPGSALSGLSEPVADVPQISEEQASINALQAQHEADLTALRAELAEQQQLAEKQAYDRGVTAGIEAAKSAEPSEEERALDELRQAEHRDVIARLEACVASAAGPDAVDEQQLATALQTAVMHLASERAGIVISENPEGLVARIVSLAERVRQKSETITVALHPEDLKSLTAYDSGPLGWKYVADEALLSGDIRISLDAIDISDIIIAAPQKRTQIAQQSADQEPDKDAGNEPEPDRASEIDLGVGGVMGADVKGDAE
jgi:flagellar biosynthesis/type III secretory pathway protein FliH